MERINLLRPRLPSPHLQRLRRYTRLALGLVGLLALTGGVYGWIRSDQAQLLRRTEALQREMEAQRAAIRRRQELAAAERQLNERGQALALVPAPRGTLARLSEDLAAALPLGCRLTQVQMERHGSLLLMGHAPTHQAVATYLERLRRQPDLAGTGFDASQRTEPEAPVSFTLRANLPRSADRPAGGGSTP